jgi:hypothetical protein
MAVPARTRGLAATMPQSPAHSAEEPLDRRIHRAALALACFFASLCANAGQPYAGRSLDEVLHEFSSRGLQLIYNQELVPPGLRISREPRPGSDVAVLEQLLAQQGLHAKPVGEGIYAIVRDDVSPAAAVPPVTAVPPIEDIVVTASRYSLAADVPDVHTFLTQMEVAALPRFADDALKAVHRLPGAASNGLSGLAHMRGGEENETQVIFDGLPLYEPFHLRLLQSPTSVLDERVLDGVDVYAGGFTAEFGDRMSAIIDARSVHPEEDAHYELGLSTFHVNALAARRFDSGRGQWVAAVRGSNLDLTADMINFDLGEPRYFDGFGRLDYAFSDSTRGSLHVLAANDSVQVTNSTGTETADARYENLYAWATLEHKWSPRLAGRALVSFTGVSSERDGVVDEPGKRHGAFDDKRDYDVAGLKLDASYSGERWLHRFGAEVRSLKATYDYTGAVAFAEGYPFPDSPATTVVHDLAPQPSGNHYAAYFTSRFRATDRLTAEIGLRWDEETYSPDADNELGPRVNLVWNLTAATRLRASWGRYQQFQGIEELQVEDGVDEFQPAQHSDHAILGLEHDFHDGYALRVEAYRKNYGQLRARYETLFDPLSLAPELRWDRVAIAPQSGRADGAEFLLTRKGSGPWSGWFSYAWSHVEDRTDGEETVRSWDQTNSVQGGATWADRGWQVTLAGSYHTGWPVTPVEVVSGSTVVVGPRNATRYAHFATLDLRVSREFALRYGSLNLFAEVTNMLDRKNPCCVDYDFESDESANVVIEREYRNWLPLVPSFGLLWKF